MALQRGNAAAALGTARVDILTNFYFYFYLYLLIYYTLLHNIIPILKAFQYAEKCCSLQVMLATIKKIKNIIIPEIKIKIIIE